MKLVRPVLTVALGAGLVISGTAGAAVKKPVCNQVQDPAGDATAGLLAPGNEPSWDIVSGDVGSDKKTVTTVIRVAKLSKSTSVAPYGSQWRFDFQVNGVKLYTQATSTPFGDGFIVGYTDSTSHSFSNSGATGVFDTAKNEVRVSFPLGAVAAQASIKPTGTHLSSLAASAGDYVNTAGSSPSASIQADDATGAKDYVSGNSTCVIVGK